MCVASLAMRLNPIIEQSKSTLSQLEMRVLVLLIRPAAVVAANAAQNLLFFFSLNKFC